MNEPAQGERDALLARIHALETERLELFARTNATIAAAQERGYWLARWEVDLDAVVRRRGVARAVRAIGIARPGGRRLIRRASR